MSRMRSWSCVVLAMFSGCIVPRSMAIGQMAAPIGAGATDVAVYSGVLYASQTTGSFMGQDANGNPESTQDKNNGFSIPAFEANFAHGFSDHVALNVHASAAGIQPGAKFTLNKSRVAHVALLPAVGIGYASVGGTTSVIGADGVLVEGAPRSQTSFTFLGGMKFLVSHVSGFFAGVGYDFMFNRNYNSVTSGGANTMVQSINIVQTISHQISASVGFDIAIGIVHIRPEVAFAVYPGISQTRTSKVEITETQNSSVGGFGFAIFPGFTISVTAPARELTDEEKQEARDAEEKEKRKRRMRGQDVEEDDEDDDDEPAPKSNLRKKKQLDEDEEGDGIRNKRRRDRDDEDDT